MSVDPSNLGSDGDKSENPTAPIHKLDYYDCNDDFHHRLEDAATRLRTIGDPTPREAVVLAHYSDNPSLTAFARSNDANWTRRVSNNPESLGKIIGWYGENYKAIYLIRLGIGPSYRPSGAPHDFVDERRINLAVDANEFVKVDLRFDKNEMRYRIV